MEYDECYSKEVNDDIDMLFKNISDSFSCEDISKLKEALVFAEEAHADQRRKGGEPYITHPIAVARIVSEELKLGLNPIIVALLHDVVEDTPHTIEEIKERFGDDVAFLVDILTKKKREKYITSKQVDNFQQMLNSIHYDIRALLIKLADRLHNMRTLKSMKPEKQMKIAGETDYFYAPLANRLGLHKIKTELENLSLKYRSPHVYNYIEEETSKYVTKHEEKLEEWLEPIRQKLIENNIKATVTCDKRSSYSIWKKMQEKNISFKEVENIRIVQITFTNWDEVGITEKRQVLRIYSILTDLYTEKPNSFSNYIDTPKENGYHSLHCKLMGNEGRWMEVHIQSSIMYNLSNYGCLTEKESGVEVWIEKFKDVLKDIAFHSKEGGFIENVIKTFYNDDIVVFSPNDKTINMPRNATALDFAYEIHSNIGNHASYAIINDKLSSIYTPLVNGDRVKIGTNEKCEPQDKWLQNAITYKAQQRIKQDLRNRKAKENNNTTSQYIICKVCEPLPGDEVIGFRNADNTLTVHKCFCQIAVSEAAQRGDVIESVDLTHDKNRVHPITILIRGVDKDGFLLGLIKEISEKQQLSIISINSTTTDNIIDCTVVLSVHSINELHNIENAIREMDNIYEVRHISHAI